MKVSAAGKHRGEYRTSDLASTTPATTRRKHEGQGPPRLFSDDQILEMRALAEFGGWARKRIEDHYDISLDSCRRYVEGTTRGHLMATREHLPPWA